MTHIQVWNRKHIDKTTDLSVTEDTVIAVTFICHMIIFHTRLATYLNDKVIDNAIFWDTQWNNC